MADEVEDVKVEGTDDSSTSEEKVEEKMIPYSRFKEVNDELKTIKESKPIETSKKDLTPEQDKELKAKEYLKSLHKEVLAEEQRAKQEAEAKELKEFKQQLNEVLDVNTDIKRADFEKFIEKEGDDYSSLTSAMKAFKRLSEVEKTGVEKGKDAMKGKPKMPSHEGVQVEAPAEDKNKSIRQIAEEAISSLNK